MESFIRRYENRYQNQMKEAEGIDSHHEINPTISAGFLSATYYPVEQLKAELSVRTEYTSLNEKVNFSPRLAVNYYLGDVVLSATAGRYTQLPVSRLLAQENKLKSESCIQYNLGAQYEGDGRFYKAELYYKKYDRLALVEKGTVNAAEMLTSGGLGY